MEAVAVAHRTCVGLIYAELAGHWFMSKYVLPHILGVDDVNPLFSLSACICFCSAKASFLHSGDTASTTTASSSCRQPLGALSDSWAHNFNVPYNRARKTFITDLNRGNVPSKTDLLDFVRVVADEIHSICRNPGRRNLQVIALRIVQDHPTTLSDIIEGQVIGSGADSLRARLEFRIDNLNRSSKAQDQEPVKRRRETAAEARKDAYGCVDFSPLLPSGDTLSSQEAARLHLKEVAEDAGVSEENVRDEMKSVYYLQRIDINSGLTLIELHERWPWLLSPGCLLDHMERLTGVDLQKALLENLQSRGKVVCLYLSTSAAAAVQHEMDERRAFGETYGACSGNFETVMLVYGLAAYFKEDASLIVSEIEVGLTIV